MADVSYTVTNSNWQTADTLGCNVGQTIEILNDREGTGFYTYYGIYSETEPTIPGLTFTPPFTSKLWAATGAPTQPGTYLLTKGKCTVGGCTSGGTLTLIVGGSAPKTMKVKVGGTWKDGTPYVKVSGAWKQGTPFVKVGGSWK